MATFLFKTDPAVYSLDDLEREGTTAWHSIRNYAARNRLQRCKPDDLVLVYQSGKSPAVVGTARIARAPHADPAQFGG